MQAPAKRLYIGANPVRVSSPNDGIRHTYLFQTQGFEGSNPSSGTISQSGVTAAALVLGTSVFGRVGSTPSSGTMCSHGGIRHTQQA